MSKVEAIVNPVFFTTVFFAGQVKDPARLNCSVASPMTDVGGHSGAGPARHFQPVVLTFVQIVRLPGRLKGKGEGEELRSSFFNDLSPLQTWTKRS